MFMAPVRTSSSRPPTALGKPAAIPAKIRIEMPLPRPRSVICSPSHIRNMVPATRLTTAVKRKPKPGLITRPAWPSSAMAMPSDWKMARPRVPKRVYCVILRRPASPSFFSCSNVGIT
eukprot:Amastigsp_a182117_8.p3 type:complete len:118 gc:universal Amastigsp_a182117_8:295-648(+)